MNLLYKGLLELKVYVSAIGILFISFVAIELFETSIFSALTFVLNNLMIVLLFFYYQHRRKILMDAKARVGQRYNLSFKLALFLVLIILEFIGFYMVITISDYSMFSGAIILVIMIYLTDTDKYYMNDYLIYRHYSIDYSSISGIELHNSINGRYVRLNLGFRSVLVFNLSILEADEMMRHLVAKIDEGKKISN